MKQGSKLKVKTFILLQKTKSRTHMHTKIKVKGYYNIHNFNVFANNDLDFNNSSYNTCSLGPIRVLGSY